MRFRVPEQEVPHRPLRDGIILMTDYQKDNCVLDGNFGNVAPA